MSNFATCCILSYNRPKFLHNSLMSLLTGAQSPLELIIHDDGSTDPEVHKVLSRAHAAGAKIILNPPGHNEGQGIALNRMFGMAKGDPILKLDQDLIYREGWLATVVDRLARPRNADVGLLGLFHYWLEPCDSANTGLPEGEGWEGDGITGRTHILGSGFALRRKTWEELGPFEERSPAFAEDWIMQRKVTDSPNWRCALLEEEGGGGPLDLVENIGFGVGPSTVVVGTPEEPTVHPIKDGPFVIREREDA